MQEHLSAFQTHMVYWYRANPGAPHDAVRAEIDKFVAENSKLMRQNRDDGRPCERPLG